VTIETNLENLHCVWGQWRYISHLLKLWEFVLKIEDDTGNLNPPTTLLPKLPSLGSTSGEALESLSKVYSTQIL
jgi:hypothetical protein